MSPDPKEGDLASQERSELAINGVPARLAGDGTPGTAAEGRLLGPEVPAEHPADPAFDPRSEREKVCMKPPCMGDRFVAVAPWMTFTLRQAVSLLGLPLQCTTQPSGDIFPLPTNVEVLQAHSGVESSEVEILRGICLGLNSMYGLALENAFPPNSHQDGVLKFLLSQSQVVSSWAEHFEETNWHDFFKLKTVDYTGEEVLCAQYTSWENLAPAMPKEIASVPLVEVCELGCRHYVENFVSYVLPEEMRQPMKPPRVLITNEAWRDVCKGLLGNGVCIPMLEQDLFHVGGQPLLNGLFGVPKGEQEQGVEIHRLIMDLRPCNKVVRGIEGDVSTLPSWATMAPLQLMPSEDLVISSEDVRCFFYIFKIPREWSAFLGFNRPIPPELCPDSQGTYYLASQVLPMGFKNSVSLAQHVHRVMVRRAGGDRGVHLQSHQEIRKDRPFTSHPELHRVYLDNFDLLEKVDKRTTALLQGELSESVLALRNEYERWGVPRHPKKSVVREHKAEVQGAIIDGIAGRAYPKPVKIMKYAQLASLLVGEKRCSMKQAQVVAGGLVYTSMFRRPLLGSLNALWKFIESFKAYPPVVHLEIPAEVKLEVARFVCLIPLAQMDFRLNISPEVTASDASTTGGGLTASVGLTGFGQAAAAATIRGDLPEPADVCAVLTVGLFDGIGALRVAADACQLPVLGHVSVEVKKEASRVLESKFPSTLFVEEGVEAVDDEMVRGWACRFSQASVVLLGAGPPCQGVSGLNSERRGALKDHRSCLFSHVRRVKELLKRHFKWAQVRYLVENVASMDDKDRSIMTEDYGDYPVMIDAAGVSLAKRPRLYWCDWELLPGEGVHIRPWKHSGMAAFREVELEAQVDPKEYLQPGSVKASKEPFPTFTTSRPRSHPGRRPAGLERLTAEERQTWEADDFRFPPYQYQKILSIVESNGQHRLPSSREREVIMGFPKDYTVQCMPKQFHGKPAHEDERKTLIGNTWNVTVVAWLLAQLGSQLGLCAPLTPQQAVKATSPGQSTSLSGLLHGQPMKKISKTASKGECMLVAKLLNLVSLKGEDIMVQASTEETLRYHRLRASLPASLWKWKTIMGWHWHGSAEHINVLEVADR